MPPRDGERPVATTRTSSSAASVGVGAAPAAAVGAATSPSRARHSLIRAVICSRVAFATPERRDRRTGSTVSSSPTVCTAYGSSADSARAVRPESRSGVDRLARAASSSFDSSGSVVASRAKIASQAERSASAVWWRAAASRASAVRKKSTNASASAGSNRSGSMLASSVTVAGSASASP